MESAAIEFRDVIKKFNPDNIAVNGVSLIINKGEIFVLLGRSGCGKTTLLRMINRLTQPTRGAIFIDGKNTARWDLIELRRRIGYVIQHIGLFPHLNVFENAALVPRLLGWPAEKIKTAVNQWLGTVRLDPKKYLSRFPSELSGGEQQRVGVARALAAGQDIVLMDEPFGALDPVTREELQEELLKLEADLRRTIVFVTHDLFEAFHLGDRIALMDQGRILACGKPRDILARANEEAGVGQFLGRHRRALEWELK